MTTPTISYLTDIYFGEAAEDVLPPILEQWNVSRPLVVTDGNLVRLGLLDALNLTSKSVFDRVPGNPTEESVLEGLAAYREEGCDGIVALGGGSPMDCAKGIALLVRHPKPLQQYALIRGGREKITADQPPVVAIPTTAGTGSEVGRGALLTFGTGVKLALVSANLIPEAAICDPKLTRDLPARLTAATGMDAISHCVETFCSPRFNPVAEAIALDGLDRAYRHIRAAVADGSDLSVRSEMMMAALQGGLTFQKGLGFIHSLSHPLGSLKEKPLHHGMLNAIFLPHVLRFNMQACLQAGKMKRLADLLGAGEAPAVPGLFEELVAEIGLPTRLRDMGVTQDDLEGMPEAALADHCCATNPQPIELDDCRAVYEAAY